MGSYLKSGIQEVLNNPSARLVAAPDVLPPTCAHCAQVMSANPINKFEVIFEGVTDGVGVTIIFLFHQRHEFDVGVGGCFCVLYYVFGLGRYFWRVFRYLVLFERVNTLFDAGVIRILGDIGDAGTDGIQIDIGHASEHCGFS